jgi:hypothetical protein
LLPLRGGVGTAEVIGDGWQENSKRSQQPRVSNTNFAQPTAETHFRARILKHFMGAEKTSF